MTTPDPKSWRNWLIAALCAASASAHADFYQAEAALAKGDLPLAFSRFRELAELGHAMSQENLAVMYVNGEGVPRDNVLGYAWAKLAIEQGGDPEAARNIVAQLEPRLTAVEAPRVAEIRARFGEEALRSQLLPAKPAPVVAASPQAGTRSTPCRMRAAANPDTFYPPEAKRQGVSGEVLIEARVAADGSVRHTRARYSVPADVFDEAGRAVAMRSRYTAATENGTPVPCVLKFKVKFGINDFLSAAPSSAALRAVEELRAKAVKGDPNSQLTYGMISSMRAEFRVEADADTWWFMKAAQAGIPAAQYLVGMQLADNGIAADRPKGLRWLEIGAKNGSGGAMTVLATHLLAAGNTPQSHEQGFEWLQRSTSTSYREGKFLFAALLVSWPDAARRDPARALALIDEVGPEFDYDPLTAEISAAAHAAQGDFKTAVRAQSKAIGIARRMGRDTSEYRLRLQAYEQGRMPELNIVRF